MSDVTNRPSSKLRDIQADEGWTNETLLGVILDALDDELTADTGEAVVDAAWYRAKHAAG